MTLAQVRLAVEEVIRDKLGTYDNGDPAISTGEPRSSRVANGLECVIDLVPQMVNRPTSDSAHIERQWTIRLISHDRGAGLAEALELLLTRFPWAQTDPLLNSPELGVLPQISIRLPDSIRVGYPRR